MISRYNFAADTAAIQKIRMMESTLSGAIGQLHLARLQNALSLALQTSRAPFPRPKLHASVRAMLIEVCTHARSCDLRAEHVVILVKKAWKELPERRNVDHLSGQDVIGEVITACIEEYFLLEQQMGGPAQATAFTPTA